MNVYYLICHCSLNVMYVYIIIANILFLRSLLLLLSTLIVVVFIRVETLSGRAFPKLLKYRIKNMTWMTIVSKFTLLQFYTSGGKASRPIKQVFTPWVNCCNQLAITIEYITCTLALISVLYEYHRIFSTTTPPARLDQICCIQWNYVEYNWEVFHERRIKIGGLI